MSKKALRDMGLLTAFCVIASLLLAFTYQLTKDPIAANATAAFEQTRAALMPEAASFTDMTLSADSGLDSCYEGLNADGATVGYIGTATVAGYGGEVEVTASFDPAGALSGVSVGGANFSETAGLGAKAKEEPFTSQFVGKVAPLRLVKGSEPKGNDTIDAISGATITSTAVVGAVNTVYGQLAGVLPAADAAATPMEGVDGTSGATAKEGTDGTSGATAEKPAKETK